MQGRPNVFDIGPTLHKCYTYVLCLLSMYPISYIEDKYAIHQDHRGRILVQVTIYRRLLIGRDGHLDQSEAYDIS